MTNPYSSVPQQPATPKMLVEQTYRYAISGKSAEVTIVIDSVDEQTDWHALISGVLGQSLQSWVLYVLVRDVQDIPLGIRVHLKADLRVHIIVQSVENRLNKRIQIVQANTCQFVCFVEPRTRLAPTFLEKCTWLIGTNPNISFCSSHSTDSQGQVWKYGFEQHAKFLEDNFVGHTFVITRSAFLSNDTYNTIFPPEIAEWEFWLRQAAAGRWGTSIAEPLMYRSAPYTGRTQLQEFAQVRVQIREQYALLRHHFPQTPIADVRPYETIHEAAVLHNQLEKSLGKRILILMPWLIVGGAERVNLDIARYLCSSDYELTFATTYSSTHHGWAEEFGAFTSDVFILDRFLRLPDYPRFLVYLIKSRQIDGVMISNSYLGYQLLPYMRAHCPNVTFVDYLHSEEEGWKSGGYPRCGVAYQELLDLNITSSEHIKHWMVARGAELERIEVAYTNVDIEKWQPDLERRQKVREQLGLTEHTPIILFIGRLSHEKRPKLLAQIIQQLNERNARKFRCFALGSGPEEATLHQQIKALKIGDILQPLGRVDDAVLYDYMAASDILLLPSQVEGISVAVFEAMAMGMIPVSAWVGGQPELVTEECGVLVRHSPNELEEYVEQLHRLINNYSLRRQMGNASRERVTKYFPLRALGPRIAEIIDRADSYRREQPRPLVGKGLGREAATQAIEYTRIERALDTLWMEREGWKSNPVAINGVTPVVLTQRQRLRITLKRMLYPIYTWALSHGIGWLEPLKDALKRHLK